MPARFVTASGPEVAPGGTAVRSDTLSVSLRSPGIQLPVPEPTAEELRQNEALLDVIHKASGGKTLWRMEMGGTEGDGPHKNH